jgi:hypothetical protein
MSHASQLPINQGFDTSLAMLAGASDHTTNKRDGFVDLWLDHGPAHGLNGSYNTFTYTQHAVDAINAHNESEPLFLYMAFQDVHAPTEAPDRFLDLYPRSIFDNRRKGLGQISVVDEAIGNLSRTLRLKGMWADSLVVWSSDNGGPSDHEPNFPLRGSKGSDFEGGVRAIAFVAGGILPDAVRGRSIPAQMHICDWYATFAALSGATDVTDHTAASLGLPPVDSINMWPVLSGNSTLSPRVEVPLSGGANLTGSALIVQCPSKDCPGSKGRFKLVRGTMSSGFFPGPTTPNGTAHGGKVSCATHGACLFDLSTDPTEHVDLAPHKPELLGKLRRRAAELDATVYQSPGDHKADPLAKAAAREQYGGFWGPWQSDEAYGALGHGEGWDESACGDCV